MSHPIPLTMQLLMVSFYSLHDQLKVIEDEEGSAPWWIEEAWAHFEEGLTSLQRCSDEIREHGKDGAP